jgi:two-component system, NtrC family, C4-dicarboxylate transport response regulator DctD
VRELRNFAERLVLDIVPQTAAADSSVPLPLQLDRYERGLIEAALAGVAGNVAAAAEQLGIPRKTLYDKLKKYQLLPARDT